MLRSLTLSAVELKTLQNQPQRGEFRPVTDGVSGHTVPACGLHRIYYLKKGSFLTKSLHQSEKDWNRLVEKGTIAFSLHAHETIQMKYFNRKTILTYLYDQLTGNFMGFLIGLSATSFVSRFFETRSLRNLWGLTAKKTVVDKDTFANLEWIVSIVIGFIVFEIMTKVVKAKIDEYFPSLKTRVLRWAIVNDVPTKIEGFRIDFANKRTALLSGVHVAVKNIFAKYSKR